MRVDLVQTCCIWLSNVVTIHNRKAHQKYMMLEGTSILKNSFLKWTFIIVHKQQTNQPHCEIWKSTIIHPSCSIKDELVITRISMVPLVILVGICRAWKKEVFSGPRVVVWAGIFTSRGAKAPARAGAWTWSQQSITLKFLDYKQQLRCKWWYCCDIKKKIH